jgi:hypothetical protein
MSSSRDCSTVSDAESASDDDVLVVIEAGVLRDALRPVTALTEFRGDDVAVFAFIDDGLCVEATADSECGSVTVFVDAAAFERYHCRSTEYELGLDVSRLMQYLELVDDEEYIEIGESTDGRIRVETVTRGYRYVTASVDPALIWGRALSLDYDCPVRVVLTGDVLNAFFELSRVLNATVIKLVAGAGPASLSAHASSDLDAVDQTVTPQQVMAGAESTQELETFADLCIAIQDVVPDTASVRYSIEQGRGIVIEYTTANGHVDVAFVVAPVSPEVTR